MKNLLFKKQTAYGKDFKSVLWLNLPKLLGFSNHLASHVKSWLLMPPVYMAHEALIVKAQGFCIGYPRANDCVRVAWPDVEAHALEMAYFKA
ncbi:hypothetical protein Tco_1194806 [Tanacetum coccineum]